MEIVCAWPLSYNLNVKLNAERNMVQKHNASLQLEVTQPWSHRHLSFFWDALYLQVSKTVCPPPTLFFHTLVCVCTCVCLSVLIYSTEIFSMLMLTMVNSCVCVCVCLWERERERERVGVYVLVYVYILRASLYIYIHVCMLPMNGHKVFAH